MLLSLWSDFWEESEWNPIPDTPIVSTGGFDNQKYKEYLQSLIEAANSFEAKKYPKPIEKIADISESLETQAREIKQQIAKPSVDSFDYSGFLSSILARTEAAQRSLVIKEQQLNLIMQEIDDEEAIIILM